MTTACRFAVKGPLLLLLCSSAISAQNFRVTLLGTGSPIPISDRSGPSTLVEAGAEKLLIDCGRGASVRLWQLHIPLGQVTAVFLTHLHSDHIVGIPDLWLTGWLPPPFGHHTGQFRIWGPLGTQEMMTNLQKAFQPDFRFRAADGIPPEGIAVLAQDVTKGGLRKERSQSYRFRSRSRDGEAGLRLPH
ncbi:MAG: ribonuclease [Bryobacterales bacterium]|nr:ribonuclease [Bryobacterales bacterium]